MKSICILGDSVVKGVVFDEEKGRYVFSRNSFDKLLSEKTGAVIKNWAKFGCTIEKGIEILKKKKELISNYDICLIEFGGNDCDLNWQEISKNPHKEHLANVPLERFKKEYIEVIEGVEETGSHPVLMTLPPLDSKRFFNWIARGLSKENIMTYLNMDVESIYRWHKNYNRVVKEIAMEENLPVLDINEAFSNLGDYSSYLCLDGMHPNEKGHRLIAEFCNSKLKLN